MDTPNAFVGRSTMPAPEEVAAVLGETSELWKQLVDWLDEQGVADQEWKSSSTKYGWSLRLSSRSESLPLSALATGVFASPLSLATGQLPPPNRATFPNPLSSSLTRRRVIRKGPVCDLW